MTNSELAGLLVSVVAVLIAALAYRNSRRTNTKLQEIAAEQLTIQRVLAKKELREAAVAHQASQRGDVFAAFRRMPGKSMHRIVLYNRGSGSAHNVNLEFVLEGRDESPLMDDDKLPITEIEPDGEYPLQVVTSSAWVPPADVEVTWDNPDGTADARTVRIDG